MRCAIFGSGQAGMMTATWLPPEHTVICFIDNDESKQGSTVGKIPVTSLGEALELGPEAILVAVLNREAVAEIEEQVTEAGFHGEVWNLDTFRTLQDLRCSALRLIACEIESRGIPGACAELGVYRGAFAAEINRLLPDRELVLLDTFSGFDEEDLNAEAVPESGRCRDFSNTSPDLVLGMLPHPEQATIVKGRFPESVRGHLDLPDTYAFVNIDPDLYLPTLSGLEYFWPRLSDGGTILVHDYTSLQYPGVHEAVREYCEKMGIFPVPLSDLHGSCAIVKQGTPGDKGGQKPGACQKPDACQ